MGKIVEYVGKLGQKVIGKIGKKGAIAIGAGALGGLGATGFGVWALVRKGKKNRAAMEERARVGMKPEE